MTADIPDYIVLAEKVSTIAEGIAAQATNCPGDDRDIFAGPFIEEGRTVIAAVYARKSTDQTGKRAERLAGDA